MFSTTLADLSFSISGNIGVCIVLLALGILLVVKGGDWFVDAASWIAEVSGIPTFIIGATIVSLATTLPEILVSSIAAANGSTGLAIGNAVGSVNCNIALIMAISLLFMPVAFKRKDYAAKMGLFLAAICVLWAVSATNGGTLIWWQAFFVLAVFIAFMVENIVSAKKHSNQLALEIGEPSITCEEVKNDKPIEHGEGILYSYFCKKQSKKITIKKTGMEIERFDIFKNIFLFILGAAGIVIGAKLMSDNGAEIARIAHMPEDLIGVTILAVGTSLPELVTTITAIIKKKSELSVGNVIGANIIDLTLILPLCAFIGAGAAGSGANLATVGLPVGAQNSVLDFPFCLAAAGVAVIPAIIMGKFKRWQGALMLAGYVAYITLLILNTVGTIHIF